MPSTDGDIPVPTYIDRRLNDHCDKNDQWQQNHLREHAALEKNIELAREVLEIRLHALNEWKSNTLGERAGFLTKAEYEAKHLLLENAARGLADKNELSLCAKAAETKGELELLREKQASAQRLLVSLLVAVVLLLVGVVVNLAVHFI